MTSSPLAHLLASLKTAPRLTADDALAVRRLVFADNAVAPQEIEALIALDEAVADRDARWTELFVEALTDFVVRQQAPAGYVDERQSAWLIDLISRDGRVKTDSELEALVHVLETATAAPSSLVVFALAQVKAAVLDGAGPLARGGQADPSRVTAGEVALLRRILHAAAGDDNLAVTRAEAEILFDINDASRGAENDPAWLDLFSKALAASVMMVSGYEPLPRAEAARQEAWLRAPEGGVSGVADFIGKMFGAVPAAASSPRAALQQILHPDDGLDGWRARNAEHEAATARAEVVTEDEATWLAARIGRDGVFDEAERRLIDFLRREAVQIHPMLAPLLDAPPADDRPLTLLRVDSDAG